MKVATKLSIAFGGLVLVLSALLVYHVRTNRSAVSALERSEVSSRVYSTTTRQLTALNQLEEAAGKFWVTRDLGYLELFRQAYADFEAALFELQISAETAEDRDEVLALESVWREFAPVAEMVNEEVLVSVPLAESMKGHLDELRVQTRRVADASQTAIAARLEASAAAARRAERISWMVGAGTLLLTVAVFTLIVQSISSGLRRLQQGTRQVALGNFEYRLPAEGGDDFAQLARDFNLMTRKLGELDRMKRDFLSKVSHELKTPLASMQETVQLMLEGMPGPITQRQRRLLELTSQSAHRLSSMIAKILDLSAMEAGALALEVRPHDVRSIVGPAVDALALGAPERATRIIVDMPERPLTIACDRDRTIQVLVNLLENAVKFSPDDAPVRISARLVSPEEAGLPRRYYGRFRAAPGPAALIEVSDQGPGVPDSEKQRIFQDFVQAAGSAKRPGRGVGLGLAICREIVDLHGGAIWVRDNSERGSVFAVLLPRASSHPGDAPVEAVPELEVTTA